MKIQTKPSSLAGTLSIPGSKSHTIRSLVFGMLAEGKSEITAPLFSADTLSCIEGCKIMGADIEVIKGDPATIHVRGVGGKPRPSKDFIDVGNSGTSLRLLAGASALCDMKITFDGDDSIRTRPMQPLLNALKNLGVKTSSLRENGKCPVTIHGPMIGGKTDVEGLSSQYLSSLLISTPLAPKDTEIRVIDLHEKPYVELTLSWLRYFGINVTHQNLETFLVKGGQTYPAFKRRIPADFSTACFPLCAAAVTKSRIAVQGLNFSDPQGDKAIFEHLKKMGMTLEQDGETTFIDGRSVSLKGMEVDMNATPDALPVMAVIGCFAEGTTSLKNVAQARIKECDRIAAMTKELRKMGAFIEELPDGMIIHHSALKGTEVHGYSDHRIVMSLALAGLASQGSTIVDTAESAAVTYPDFVKDMQSLGADLSLV